jgi:sugar phosphate isomerase/epimerase
VFVSVYTESLSPNFAEALAIAERLGLTAVDLRTVSGRERTSLGTREVRRLRRELAASPVQLTCVSGLVFGKGLVLHDDAGYRQQLEAFRRLLGICGELGAAILRVFAFDKPNSTDWRDRPAMADHLPLLITRLERPVRLAEAAGVVLAVETEGETHVGTCREARMLLDALPSRSLRVCWDVLNGGVAGEEPAADAYEFIRGMVTDVHCKDGKRDPLTGGWQFENRCLLGRGDLPYRRMIRRLRQDGYRGPVLAERMYSRQGSSASQSPRLMRELVNEIEEIRTWIESA